MSYFLNKAGKELFGKHIQQYAPPDPLYDYSIDTKGKKKRSKRPLPPGLSKRDAKILKTVQTRAHRLDKGFSLCGLRFGWTFLIALIPVAGSVADACLNYVLVIRKARQADIPHWLEARMLFNSTVSVGVSFIPIVGDIVLAVWKANSRNAVLLEEFLRIRGAEWLREQAEREERERRREAASGGNDAATTAASASSTTATEKKKKKGWSGILMRWRGLGESDKKQVKPGASGILQPTVDDDHDDNGDDHSTGDEITQNTFRRTSCSKRRLSELLGSLGGKKSSHNGHENPHAAKAPPAGEKGRFVEHVPDHELWRSTPM